MKRVLFFAGTIAALLIASHAVAAVVPSTVWTVSTTDWYYPSIAAAPSGGVYVASTTHFGDRATLTCYSNAGAALWSTSIDGASGEKVQSDAAGNAYLAGETYISLDGPNQGAGDVYLRKYSPTGTLLWGRQFGTPDNDWPAGLAVTPGGSAHVTSGGWPTNYGIPAPGSVTTIHQFLPDGSSGWTADLDPGDGTCPGGSAMMSRGTTIDSQGNIVAVFSNYTSTMKDGGNYLSFYIYLSKTNAAGQVQWIKPLTEVNNWFCNATDASANTYVTSGTRDTLAKYDADGNLDWRISNDNNPIRLVADLVSPDGTIYAAGSDGNLGYLAAYSPQGELLWSQTYQPPAGHTKLAFDDLAISGNQLVLAGQLFNRKSDWSGNYLVALAVPEPSALLLLAPVLLLLLRRGLSARR
jgi:hypothetical protein